MRTPSTPDFGRAGSERRPILRLSLLPLAFLLPLAVAAAPPSDRSAAGDREAPFRDSAEVTVVEVPVQVVHRGAPVRDLERQDFAIYDEGVRRPIASFEIVDHGSRTPETGVRPSPPAERPEPPPAAARRHILLLFDLAFSRPEDLVRAERAARRLVAEGLAPHDLVGIALYTPYRGAMTLLRFTTDREQVLAVLGGLRSVLEGGGVAEAPEPAAAPPAERRFDPLGITTGITGVSLAEIGRLEGVQTLLMEQALAFAGPFDGLGGALELNKMMNFIWHLDQSLQDRRAGDVAALAESFAALADDTAGISGLKHLVLFSRGFDADLLQTKTRSDKFGIPGPQGAVFGVGGGAWILTEVDDMLRTMRQSGWSIHAVELGGLGGNGADFGEGLFFFAEETGGAFYENLNDPAVALDSMMERTSVTYLLSFQVSDLPEEPALRRLRVEVDGLPRRAHIVHRAAYERPRAWSELPPRRRRAESAETLLAGSDRDPLGIRVLALPHRLDGDHWSVPVALEVDGLSLLAGDLERVPGAELYVYAFDASGTVVDLVAHRVVFREPDARGRLAQRGLKFLGDLTVPTSGHFRIRFLVRSLRSGEAALRTVSLELPGSDDRTVLLPPVLVTPDDGTWVVASEVDPDPEGGRPFTLHGRQIVPAVGSLSAARNGDRQRGRLLVLGYGLDRSSARLRATVTGTDGGPVRQATFLSRTPGGGTEPDLLVAALPDDLAPGSYIVRVSLVGADGTTRGTTRTRLQIEPVGGGA